MLKEKLVTSGKSQLFRQMISRILIGGSAGSFEQVITMFKEPYQYSLPPIVYALHISENADVVSMRQTLNNHIRIPTVLVENGQTLQPNHMHLSTGAYHVLLENEGRNIRLFDDEPYGFSKPSIDLLFKSCIGTEAKSTLAILLSGSNADGANGLQALSKAGATCAICAPDTALFNTMPLAGKEYVPQAAEFYPEAFYDWLSLCIH